jgi:uncharacterized protein YcbX
MTTTGRTDEAADGPSARPGDGPSDGASNGAAMTVRELWRYPVKSMGGERLEVAAVTAEGFAGDRAYGIVDDATGRVLTGRRAPELLLATASLAGGALAITLPDGRVTSDDADLSAWLGRPVHLQAAHPDVAGRYETVLDVEHEETADWYEWEGPPGPFHDSTRTRVSLVSIATIRDWDARRFRANVLLSGAGEDDLVGHTIEIGDVRLDVQKPIDRCVMVTRPQPGGIARDLDVLRTINRERAGNLGVGALVARPGTIAVGAALTAAG